MSTVQAQNYATMRETPFAVQAVKLAQLSVVLEPQFSQLESAKLETDPAQAIRSEGDQRWQTLAGWLGSLILNDPEKPRLSCRKACFTAWLDASGFASDIALLPFGAQSPSAELVYTTGNGPSLRHKLQSLLDVNQHFLRLDLPFESSPVGRALYDEIFGAMTNPASEIAIEVSYSHQFQVPGFSANPAVSATAINDNRPVFVRNQTTGVTKAQPMASRAAPQDHATVQPAAMRFQAADVERADFQREAVMVRRPVDREVVEEPDISPSEPRVTTPRWPPPYVSTTFTRMLAIRAFRPRDHASAYPDLAREQQRGWGQLRREGGPVLHYRDTPEADCFEYLPSCFKLGFYGERDGSSTRPPFRVTQYLAGSEYRVKAMLLALPTMAEADREALRDYLRDTVLHNMLPAIRLDLCAGLKAKFIGDFMSGPAGDALPVDIVLKSQELDLDDYLQLEFDMPQWHYAIFCELLKKGLRGRVSVEGDAVQESIEARLRLDDITTSALDLSVVSKGAESPQLILRNRLDLAVELPSLKAVLMDRGEVTHMLLAAEVLDLLSNGPATLGPASEASSTLSLPLMPKHIGGYDSVVPIVGEPQVLGGTPEEWLSRFHRDPSLQDRRGFTVKVALLRLAPGTEQRVKAVRLRLYKAGESTARGNKNLVPGGEPWEMPVEMTLAELAGEGGHPPAFFVEYDTHYVDDSFSFPQREEVLPQFGEIALSVLVDSPASIYTLEYDGSTTGEGGDKAAVGPIVDRLRSEGRRRWHLYAREA